MSEVLFTCCKSAEQWSVCAWDYASGNALQIYRNGGVATPRTLEILCNDFILTAEQGKPLLHAWPINSQDQVNSLRLILPEPANCLSVCPYSCYLAVGIGTKLYTWHLSSGKLLNVQKKHFQPIVAVKFSSCGDYLVAGGQDGMLVTYSLVNAINVGSTLLPQSVAGQVEPLYTKLDHSMPITDICVGQFDAKSRFATVSADQTCRMYNLFDGEHLLTLILADPLSSVVFDGPCWNLYLGSNSGVIRQFQLTAATTTVEHYVEQEGPQLKFIGHQKKVNCLSLSISGEFLVSGSDDFNVFVWEVQSRQVLRKIEHKSPVTIVRFSLGCANMKAQCFTPQVVLKNLQRSLNLEDEFEVFIMQNDDIVFTDEEDDKDETEAMAVEINKLKKINKQLYVTNLNLIEKFNKK